MNIKEIAHKLVTEGSVDTNLGTFKRVNTTTGGGVKAKRIVFKANLKLKKAVKEAESK